MTSKIDEIKEALRKNTEEWARTANQVIKEAQNGLRPENDLAENSNRAE